MNEDNITRTSEETIKEGIFTGHYAINPVNGEKVQIWITNYVLMDYGTGAVMAVPTHDQRDFEFAKKYDIPLKIVIQNPDAELVLKEMTEAYTEPGILVNSEKFDGMDSVESQAKISQWMDENGMGKTTITYRLRDWGVSRQRYWGNPIPLVYCEKCGEVLIPDADLPVELPENVQLGKTTQNPLLSVEDWVNTTCPKCGGAARRETDTMDTFVDSSWYFARYTDSDNTEKPFASDNANYWLPVDQYIGGIEHACMHLLYARFFHKFMRDLGMVNSDEPFARLLTQGMVTKDGAKMSKSKGNVVDPQYIIDRYGSDTVRTFMLFASPPEKDVEWSDEGVKGAFRFINRVWRMFDDNLELIKTNLELAEGEISSEFKELRFSTHHMIQKVQADIENKMQFNTAIASIMEHLNNLSALKNIAERNSAEKAIFAEAAIMIPRLLYPFAPHVCEELWQKLGNQTLIHAAGIPQYNPKFLVKDEVTYVVQIMGKLRGSFEINVDASQDEIKQQALQLENVQKHLAGKKVLKMIVVPKKLVSIVAK